MTQDERNELCQAIIFSLKQEGFGHQFKAEATVSLSIGGFPWTMTVRSQSHPDLMDALPKLSTALEALGCKPPAAPVAAPVANGNGGPKDVGRPPVCPDHGTPMKLMDFGGHKRWKCTRSIGDKHDEEGNVMVNPEGHKFVGQPQKIWCKKVYEIGEV